MGTRHREVEGASPAGAKGVAARMSDFMVSSADREQLRLWVTDPATPNRLRRRAELVAALADGLADREVARQLDLARQTVALWRRRVLETGSVLTLTMDAPGRGRKPSVPPAVRARLCEAYRLAQHAGRPRSVRDLAREFGLSAATVHRTLKAGLAADPGPARRAPVRGTSWRRRDSADGTASDEPSSPAA